MDTRGPYIHTIVKTYVWKYGPLTEEVGVFIIDVGRRR